MHHHFGDIRERIDGKPKWWDENGVPRYCKFSPDETANIYRNECALCVIACQNCGHAFQVAFSEDSTGLEFERPSLSELIDDRKLHYGDPPNADCCAAGASMNSVMMRVIEYWKTPEGEFGLVRDHAREVRFDH